MLKVVYQSTHRILLFNHLRQLKFACLILKSWSLSISILYLVWAEPRIWSTSTFAVINLGIVGHHIFFTILWQRRVNCNNVIQVLVEILFLFKGSFRKYIDTTISGHLLFRVMVIPFTWLGFGQQLLITLIRFSIGILILHLFLTFLLVIWAITTTCLKWWLKSLFHIVRRVRI